MSGQAEYFESRFTYNEDRLKVWRYVVSYVGQFIHPTQPFVELGAG